MKRLLRAAFVATTAFVVGSADNRTSGYVKSDGVNVDGVQQNKILFLDGLRGIAILMVVIWHAYGSAYAEYLPYGDQYNVIPIRFFGFGVHLFFIISGFVILMTLERCSTLLDFALRRWLRLFPAMLVASVIILAFDLAFSLGPHGQRTWINLVPGLLFIESFFNSYRHGDDDRLYGRSILVYLCGGLFLCNIWDRLLHLWN